MQRRGQPADESTFHFADKDEISKIIDCATVKPKSEHCTRKIGVFNGNFILST